MNHSAQLFREHIRLSWNSRNIGLGIERYAEISSLVVANQSRRAEIPGVVFNVSKILGYTVHIERKLYVPQLKEDTLALVF